MHNSAENGALSKPPWTSLLNTPHTRCTGHCQALDKVSLSPTILTILSRAHNPAVGAVPTGTPRPSTAVMEEVRFAVGGEGEEVAGVIAPHSTVFQEAAWGPVVLQKQRRPYSTGQLRCCWASQGPRANAHQLRSTDPILKVSVLCSPLCLTSECPTAFS